MNDSTPSWSAAAAPVNVSVAVAVAANEAYAMPLAAMVRSLLENLRRGYTVDLFVLEDTVSPSTRDRLTNSWSDFPIRTHWISPDTEPLATNVQLGGYAGVPSTYFRILVGELLPKDVRRIIYLDADLLVLADLGDLWSTDLGANPVGAVQIRPSLQVALDFVPEGMDFTRKLPCFNTGVLLIDLDAWRREGLGPRTLEIARRYRRSFRSWDQDALNCTLVDRWQRLPLGWNYRPESFALPAWQPGAYSAEESEEARRAPKIVHFAGEHKPWQRASGHPYAEKYFRYLDRTAWMGWRPPRVRVAERAIHALLTVPHRRTYRLLEIAIKTRKASVSYSPYVPYVVRTLLKYPWLLITYPLLDGRALRRFIRTMVSTR